MSNPQAADTNVNGTNGIGATEVPCVSCGQGNLPDSRFCRHCGATFSAPAPATPAAATPVVPSVAVPAVVAPLVTPIVDDENLSSAEIDARRAHHLLDRASSLSEHGDMAGAILACRQAVALDPNSPAAFSLLGQMLERHGDSGYAIAAYEKVLALAPDSALERDSLERLRAATTPGGANAVNAAAAFHFNDDELFEDTSSAAPDAVPAVDAATAPQSAIVDDAAASAVAATGGDATRPFAFGAPLPAGAGGTAPNSAAQPGSSAAPLVAPALSPLDLDLAPPDLSPQPLWMRALRDRPSFYLRSAPLLAVSALGLAFMLWARGAAVSRNVAESGGAPALAQVETRPEEMQNGGAPADNAPATGAASGPNGAPGATSAGAPANPAFPINNGQSAAPTARYAPPASSNAAPANSGPANNPPPLPSPNLARRTPATAGGAPAAASPGGNNSFAGIPPARIMTPPRTGAPPVVSAAGGDSGAASSGGGPMGLGGSQRRGSIRVSGQPPTMIPPASPPRADSDNLPPPSRPVDRTPAGNTSGAASGLSAGGSVSDAGYRFQRRALLYLEQGDYSRAVDEFRGAIAAYNDQIARGVRVDEARKGINACRSGLRLAQANLRR